MSLRLRLIVAFFFLSVVPLAAVTLITYASNARAMREAAGREAELLAGELSQRMQVVTAQLSERVVRLMDVAEARAEANAALSARAAAQVEAEMAETAAMAEAAETAAVSAQSPTQELQVAQALGEMAMLLDNIELRGLRLPPPRGAGPNQGRFGGAGGRAEGTRSARVETVPRPASAPQPAPAPVAPSPPAVPVPPVAGPAVPPHVGRRPTGARSASAQSAQTQRSEASPTTDSAADTSTRATPPPPGAFPPPPPADRRAFTGPEAPVNPNATPRDRILIDVGPMRRDIVRQFVPEGQWEKLTEAERQRIMTEVNQRMLGIAQGIQLGAAEAQKRVAEAQRAADAKAQAAVAAVKSTPRPAPVRPVVAVRATPARRKTALSGTRLDVTFERDGQVVRAANAEVNLPNLLATVLTTTTRAIAERFPSRSARTAGSTRRQTRTRRSSKRLAAP